MWKISVRAFGWNQTDNQSTPNWDQTKPVKLPRPVHGVMGITSLEVTHHRSSKTHTDTYTLWALKRESVQLTLLLKFKVRLITGATSLKFLSLGLLELLYPHFVNGFKNQGYCGNILKWQDPLFIRKQETLKKSLCRHLSQLSVNTFIITVPVEQSTNYMSQQFFPIVTCPLTGGTGFIWPMWL